MNEQDRSELEWLKQQHARLEEDLTLLSQQLKRIESRLASTENVAAIEKAVTPSVQPTAPILPSKPDPTVPPPIPPIIPQRSLTEDLKEASQASSSETTSGAEPASKQKISPKINFVRCRCEHCSGELEVPPELVRDSIPCPHCGLVTLLTIEKQTPAAPPVFASPPLPPPPAASKPVTVASDRSFEMRLGTYWLVRIGIVMLLTGLVFFGNYAYQNYIGKLGPAGKVSLLYLASGILLGAGTWWQRKAEKESLKNYAQVLFAGGLAAVYFTTYAAHHIANLRVIESPLLDGALLLGWAGFMVWIADRKKSEVLALFAVGLAYYTSVITGFPDGEHPPGLWLGSFTLYSNLVLAMAAVFFLVRNRWAGLTVASLVATYAAYGFWRFFDGSNWHWASPEQGLWHGTYFLLSYWVVFTAAVFLSKREKLVGPNRATFITLNNGAFFVMFLLTMLQVRHGKFWEFSLIYGTVLLGLSELARRTFPSEPLAKNSYLTQGLLLVTVGLISKYSGLQLALCLGAESVVLLTLGMMRSSPILQAGAYICGALAVGWGIDGLERDEWRKLLYNAAVGGMMAFNAFWSHRPVRESKSIIRPVPTFFTILALISWLATTWYNTRPENFPLALAVEAAVLTCSIYLFRMREMALFGQGYLLLAQGVWLVYFVQPEHVPPWWNPALLIAITLGLSHWWQRQKQILAGNAELSGFWQALYALAIVGVFYLWLNPLVSASHWLVLTSALAVGITAYGVFTRSWFLALCGQIFVFVSAAQFVLLVWKDKPEWYFALAPIAALAFLSLATIKWFQHKPESGEKVREPLLQVALIYRWVALVMSICWVQEYIPERERIWVLALMSVAAFSLAGWQRNSEALLFSAAFTAFGLGLFWLPRHESVTIYLPNLLAFLLLLGKQRAAKHFPDRFPLNRQVHGAMIVCGALSIWLLLTRWICQTNSGFFLTASWSALALILFTLGILLRERIYRWLGLGVLAMALGRVFIIDVWKLDTLYRILSFMALGVVLLVLGFIYNKYQEKIKEWL